MSRACFSQDFCQVIYLPFVNGRYDIIALSAVSDARLKYANCYLCLTVVSDQLKWN